MAQKPTPQERFWRRVRKTDACWEWTASLSASGYGQFSINHRMIRAHRFSYEINVGPIPEGLVIDHLCRNRKCVNPAHLEAVTFRENVLRGFSFSAKNAQKTECDYGHSDWVRDSRGDRRCRPCMSRLRTEQLRRIRESKNGL